MKKVRVLICLVLSISIYANDFSYKRPSELNYCVAVRGNGDLMPATLHSLARISEDYGPLDGISGASSGSVASFLYESMIINPNIRDCNGSLCTKEEQGKRIGLLLKSFVGYIDVYKETKDVQVIMGIANIYQKIQSEEYEGFLSKTLAYARLVRLFVKLITSPDVEEVIDNKIYDHLCIGKYTYTARQYLTWCGVDDDIKEKNPNISRSELRKEVNRVLKGRLNRIIDGIKGAASFSTEQRDILFRSGIIDFKAAMTLFSRIADFYAGYGVPMRGKWQNFFNQCTAKTQGLSWGEIVMAHPDCVESYEDLATTARQNILKIENNHRSHRRFKYTPRAKESVGKYMASMASTSALIGQQYVDKFKNAQKEYNLLVDANDVSTFSLINKDIDFTNHFRTLYFGNFNDIMTIFNNPEKRVSQDRKTQIMSFNFFQKRTLWAEALYRSAGEPGFQPLQPYGFWGVTAGGWADSGAVKSLQLLGCEKVFYITRAATTETIIDDTNVGETSESGFATGVATMIGMTPDDFWKLYARDNEDSSANYTINEAHDVWCTNWNDYSMMNEDGGYMLMKDGYNSGFSKSRCY